MAKRPRIDKIFIIQLNEIEMACLPRTPRLLCLRRETTCQQMPSLVPLPVRLPCCQRPTKQRPRKQNTYSDTRVCTVCVYVCGRL